METYQRARVTAGETDRENNRERERERDRYHPGEHHDVHIGAGFLHLTPCHGGHSIIVELPPRVTALGIRDKVPLAQDCTMMNHEPDDIPCTLGDHLGDRVHTPEGMARLDVHWRRILQHGIRKAFELNKAVRRAALQFMQARLSPLTFGSVECSILCSLVLAGLAADRAAPPRLDSINQTLRLEESVDNALQFRTCVRHGHRKKGIHLPSGIGLDMTTEAALYTRLDFNAKRILPELVHLIEDLHDVLRGVLILTKLACRVYAAKQG